MILQSDNMANMRNRNRTYANSPNQNGNNGFDQEIQQESNSGEPNNNIDVIPYGERRSNLLISRVEPEPPIDVERITLNVIQPSYGLLYDIVPPPRVIVASSSVPLGLHGINSGGIWSSRICHLYLRNLALENILNSPVTSTTMHSFKQQMDESN